MEKGRNEVMGLLTQLTSASTKSIPPIGAKVETEDIKADRLLANLETIVSRKMEASAATTVEGYVFGSFSEDLFKNINLVIDYMIFTIDDISGNSINDLLAASFVVSSSSRIAT